MNMINFGDALYIKGRIGWQALKKDEYLSSGDYLLITGVDINEHHRVNFKKCYYVSKERYDADSNIQIQEGDIILTKDGTIGKVGYIEDLPKPATLNSHLFLLRVKDKSLLDSKYLYFCLQSGFFQRFASNNTSGSNIPAFTQKNISYFSISVPDISEQKKIVSVLSVLENLIIEYDNNISKLKELSKSLYDYWFLDFNFPDEKGRSYKASGGKMIWNDEIKREIPEGWSVKSVGRIVEFLDSERVPLSKNEREKLQGSIPYYGATGVMDYINQYLFDETLILLAEDGSVMEKDGSPIIQIITGKSWVNNHTHVLRPRDSIMKPMFIYQLLKTIPVKMLKTGSIQAKINQNNLANFKLPIPDSDLIEKYNTIGDQILSQLFSLQSAVHDLISFRDFLLPLLMNGQVKIEDIKSPSSD